MKDPTARAATRNAEGRDRAAYLVHRDEDGHPERYWLNPANLRTLAGLVIIERTDDGERHIRFKQEAAALSHQDDGSTPTKGTHS